MQLALDKVPKVSCLDSNEGSTDSVDDSTMMDGR